MLLRSTDLRRLHTVNRFLAQLTNFEGYLYLIRKYLFTKVELDNK